MSLKAVHCFGSGHLPIGATGTGSASADAGLDSGYCTHVSTNNTVGFLPGFVAASLATMVIAGARVRLSGNNSRALLLTISRGGDDYCFIRQEEDGSFSVYVSTAVTSTTITIATGITPSWDPTEYNYYELAWIPDDSAGTILMRVNGVAPAGWTDVLPADTVDTKASSSSALTYSVGAYRFSNEVTIRQGDVVLYDDVDNGDGWVPSGQTLIGPVRIPWLPAASSGESDWAGSDGNSVDNHLLLDEIPSATTDNVSSATVTDRQVVGHSGTIPVAGTVLAVQAEVFGRDDDAGSQQIELGVRSNVSETVDTITFTPSDGLHQVPVPLDPDGGGAWGDETGAAASAEMVMEVV